MSAGEGRKRRGGASLLLLCLRPPRATAPRRTGLEPGDPFYGTVVVDFEISPNPSGIAPLLAEIRLKAADPVRASAVDADGVPLPADVQMGDARTPGFDWAWGQHAAMILPDGNLLLLDNGDDRQFGAAPPPDYTRGVEYAIDEAAMTVRQVWAYSRSRGQEFFAPFVSDIDYLPATGDRLIMPGIRRASRCPSRFNV